MKSRALPFRPSRDAAAVAAYLALAVFFCRPFFFGGKILCEAGTGDEFKTYYPSLVYFLEWVRQGVWPLWNTLSMCGQPFGLHSVGLFDLYHLLSAAFGLRAGYSLAVFSGVLLNGVLLYVFLRRRGFSRFGSFVGGFIWMLASSRGTENGFFFLALSFVAADFFLESKTARRGAGLALALALFALNANPQHLIYGASAVAAYLFYTERSISGRRSARVMAGILALFALAAGLVMFHYARMIELAALSNRSSFRTVQTLLPTHLPLLLFPHLYENPARPDLAFVVPSALQKIFAAFPATAWIQDFIAPPAAGAFPFLAFCAAFFIRSKDRATRFFLGLASAVLLYLVLHPLIYRLVESRIPLVGGMYAMTRIFDVLLLAFAVLSARACDLVLCPAADCGRALGRAAAVIAVGAAVFLAVLFAFRFGLHAWRPAVEEKISQSLRYEPGFVNTQAADRPDFERRKRAAFFEGVDLMISPRNIYLVRPLFMLGALGWAVWARRRGRIGRRAVQAVIGLVVAADLFAEAGLSSRAADPEDFTPHRETAGVMKADPGVWRAMTLEDARTSYTQFFLRPQQNMAYGIATPDGLEQFYNRRYARAYSVLTKRREPPTIYLHPTSDFDDGLARFLNCRYAVTSLSNRALDREGFTRISAGPAFKVYRNERAFERVFAVREAVAAPDEETAARLLERMSDKLDRRVILEGTAGELPVFEEPSRPDRITIRRPEPHRLETELDLGAGAWIVASEVFYPGWNAYLDGKRVKILVANLAFRAVRAEAGRHTLVFRYEPFSVIWGGAVSLTALAILLSLCCFGQSKVINCEKIRGN